jgi:hypothetical protein
MCVCVRTCVFGVWVSASICVCARLHARVCVHTTLVALLRACARMGMCMQSAFLCVRVRAYVLRAVEALGDNLGPRNLVSAYGHGNPGRY